MRTLVIAVAVLSLLACLASAVLHFAGVAAYSTYTSAFLAFSITYFVSAGIWAEMRR
jgi:hypothetical protein